MIENIDFVFRITSGEDGYRYAYRYGEGQFTTIEPRDCLNPPSSSIHRFTWDRLSQWARILEEKVRRQISHGQGTLARLYARIEDYRFRFTFPDR